VFQRPIYCAAYRTAWRTGTRSVYRRRFLAASSFHSVPHWATRSRYAHGRLPVCLSTTSASTTESSSPTHDAGHSWSTHKVTTSHDIYLGLSFLIACLSLHHGVSVYKAIKLNWTLKYINMDCTKRTNRQFYLVHFWCSIHTLYSACHWHYAQVWSRDQQVHCLYADVDQGQLSLSSLRGR